MADLNISLEEYDALREERDSFEDKVKELQEQITGLQNKSRVIVTRWDRQLSQNQIDFCINELSRGIVNRLNTTCDYETTNCYPGLYTMGYDRFSNNITPDQERAIHNIVDNVFSDLCRRFINTREKSNVSISSQIVNFEDVEENVKTLYDKKWNEEYILRVQKLEEKEKLIDKRNDESLAKHQKASYELKTAKQYFEETQNALIKERDDSVELVNELKRTIDSLKREKQELLVNYSKECEKTHDLTDKVNILSETVMNQSDKIEKVQHSWWFKWFNK